MVEVNVRGKLREETSRQRFKVALGVVTLAGPPRVPCKIHSKAIQLGVQTQVEE